VKSLSALRVIAVSVVILSLIQLVLRGVASPGEQGPYVFYGYAPSLPASLDIVGINDTTRVEVYNLTDKTLIASKTINRMELWSLSIGTRVSAPTTPPGGDTYFKVVSDKIVAVYLGGGTAEGSVTFYPSTDGGSGGREFIFMATHTMWGPGRFPEYGVYHIFAVENSHVTIFNATGRVVELDAPAGSFKKVALTTGSVYRVASTGRVMVAGMSDTTFKYLPSLTGGFVGRHFMGTVGGNTAAGDKMSLYVVAQEDAEVSVYDTTKPGSLSALTGPDVKKTLRAGESWYNTTIKCATPIRIDSTGNITVLIGKGRQWWGIGYGLATGETIPAVAFAYPEAMGDDISALGARAGEALSFYAPTQAVIFATQDMSIEIDGVTTTMTKDEYLTVLAGIHTVRGTAPVIVEVLGRSPYGWVSWGGYLVSQQAMSVLYPEPPPLGSLTEIIAGIGAAVAVVVAVVVVLLLRRRAATKPTGQA